MSLTYIVLNLLLQNELARKKKESDIYDRMINLVLLINLKSLYAQIMVRKNLN